MAAPLKGTARYKRKLLKHKLRRQSLRQATLAASPTAVKARREEAAKWQRKLREADARADLLSRRANQHFRKLTVTTTKVQWCCDRLDALTEEKKDLQGKLQEARRERAQAQARADAADRKLSKWELWWAWASANAGQSAAARFCRLGAKRPRRTSDRAGPHGAQ